MAAHRVEIDVNNPGFLDVFLKLKGGDLQQVATALARLRAMDWSTVYASSGLHWEEIEHRRGPNDAALKSVRLGQKCRALVYRDGDVMRFVSLHPDHDSSYKRPK